MDPILQLVERSSEIIDLTLGSMDMFASKCNCTRLMSAPSLGDRLEK